MEYRIYRLVIRYDGTFFSGFQRLPGAVGARTIQGVLEDVLSKIVAHPVRVHTAGRTDSGVHATAQVVSFRCYTERRPEAFLFGANGMLPDDLRIIKAELAPAGFHARYSALARKYEYLLWPTRCRDVFFDNRVTRVPEDLDWEAMDRAAQLLVGKHDFSSFGVKVPPDVSRVKNLMELSVGVSEVSGPCCFGDLGRLIVVRAKASGFLRRMVRMLGASLVKVGRGQWTIEQPRELLEKRDPYFCPPPLASGGLYFVGVDYPQE